ncbi:MAG: hypothetical protein QOJ03_3361 [Frankiaceae bacterium]|jgi:uncharacterized protein (TIGR03083 family)|nr:hypothetical protein [Frankiaceae bacterium]
MADDAKTWAMTHAERKTLADTIAGLTPQQWAQPSLCGKWTVGQLAAHILAGAEQTPGKFFKGMVTSGFRFDTSMDRTARSLGRLSQDEIVGRFRQRLTTTNRPPAPAMAMLGEVVVHGEDLRRPLGLVQPVAAEALNACLDMYTKASFPVGGKKRIQGLRLETTDTGWSYGEGPEVSGPALSVLLAMTGRPAGLDGLSGDGAALLRQRLVAQAA